MADDSTKNPVIGNIVDAFKVLDIINLEQEIGISNLAQKLDLPKTRIFRIMKSLEEVKAVKQLENSNYCLDYHMLKFAKGVTIKNRIIDIAEPHMKKAVEITGESINLGMEYKDDLVILRRMHGDFYQLQTSLRPVGDLYCSGMGKLFLAQRDDEDLKSYFTNVSQRTVRTITSFEEFKAQQKNILESGLSFDDEEYEYGLSCYAVPIFDSKGILQYAISISGPSSRLEYKGIDFLMDTLKKCAIEIQKDMELTQ
ncbi:MAG: IclR family transcriptional regulator [Erysipelothrix sp.]